MFLWTDSDCSGRAPRMGRGLAALALFFCLLAADVRASGDQRSGYEVWTPLVERLVADGFAPGDLRRLFSDPVMVYDPQVMARKMSPLLDAKLAPPEPKAAEPEVDARYLNPILLAGAYGYLRENKDLLRRLRDRYGVPEEVLVALLLVETKLGLNTGTAKAAWALANMALARNLSDIEPYLSRSDLDPEIRVWLDERTRQKSDWAYEELEALLRYAEALGRDPLDIPGSAYGAIGQCQFMPTNALAYGEDGDGDGRVDLFAKEDALASMARFLKEHGWKDGLDEQGRFRVIYRYNHSASYARTVLAVADSLTRIGRTFGAG
ncbi:lytic murein transglycosylase [Desulfovibrio aminophilus]|uniref:lytic murein transglycosylase n=1 Tax=Desulfovibrio aminophilus TaxID=81425 RepID=UPI00047F37B6|nr:lytic murein transglycosylase [Desulfovibrio aminophilus]